jgi:hypothetical protein
VRVIAVTTNLLLYSRIESAAAGAGAPIRRVDDPSELPPADDVDLVLVDWTELEADRRRLLADWHARARETDPRLILFGAHTDLQAHEDAKANRLGPMWARSRLVRELPQLLR